MAINYSNVTDVVGFVAAANAGSANLFWTATVYLLWIVLIGAMTKFGFLIAVISGSLVSLLLSIPLVILGLVNLIWIAPIIGLLLVLFVYTAFIGSRE